MMKPVWTYTLAWIAAVAVAVLFALSGPESDQPLGDPVPVGATAPR